MSMCDSSWMTVLRGLFILLLASTLLTLSITPLAMFSGLQALMPMTMLSMTLLKRIV